MRILKKYLFGKEIDILEVSIVDAEDIAEIRQKYTAFQCIEIDLSSMCCLDLFPRVTTLVLTGGVPTADGLISLYHLKHLTELVLDYEETDTDADGIELEQFPALKNVLSRSNLNIKNFNPAQEYAYAVEVLNFYQDGKAQKVRYAPNANIFQPKRFLFFSTEARMPASEIIMETLVPIEKLFHEQYGNCCFSENIDKMAIIPVCVPQPMIDRGFGKERRCVSPKKRTADMRLRLPYDMLMNADPKGRLMLCLENIKESARYVAGKDKSFQFDAFMAAINDVAAKAYQK